MITVLLGTVLVAGLMAVVVIVWKKRVGRTLRNLGHLVAALFTLHLPGPELSLDNPESSKIPFGVAMAVAVVLYTVGQAWHAF
jgi:predicted membrane channel-forming protein YqfA (hemolysin III family)